MFQLVFWNGKNDHVSPLLRTNNNKIEQIKKEWENRNYEHYEHKSS